MNQLKSGTLIVAIATIVTVILILMTGRDEVVNPAHEEVASEKMPSAQPKLDTTENEKNQVITEVTESASEVTQQLTTSSTESVKPDAPNGPFTNTSDLVNQPAQTVTNDNSVTETTTQHDLLNHIVQPIWMDQKLGDFKSIEQSEVVFKLMPKTPNGLQGSNPTEVITSKSDKFAPQSIPSNYNYQQMPMYNGGYYIAPMPSYLMPSMLPGKATIESGAKAKTQN